MPIEIADLLSYDPETGWFTNRYSRGRAKVGERAGSPSGHGYRKITIDDIKHYEHHLAWLFIHGEYPDEIDHVNGDGCDNRIANLRVCTRSENNFNAQTTPGASGLKGAYLDKRSLKWYSHIQLGGKVKHLGNFDSAEKAHQAYLNAAEEVAGEFAHHMREI